MAFVITVCYAYRICCYSWIIDVNVASVISNMSLKATVRRGPLLMKEWYAAAVCVLGFKLPETSGNMPAFEREISRCQNSNIPNLDSKFERLVFEINGFALKAFLLTWVVEVNTDAFRFSCKSKMPRPSNALFYFWINWISLDLLYFSYITLVLFILLWSVIIVSWYRAVLINLSWYC